MIEVLAAGALEFVYIDGEHGRFDWRDVETACITAERHGLTPIARIPDTSSATITRFLDRGVRGIVVPHVESVEDARHVDGCRVLRADRRSLVRRRPSRVLENGADRPAYMKRATVRSRFA